MKKQSFLESSAILILSAVVTKLMGAVFRIPLANMLGGEGMGYFSSAYGIFMTVYAVSVTGLPAAVAKLTAENSALERFANVRRVRSSALLFFSAAGLAFTLLMLAAAYPFCMLTGGRETVPSVLAIAPSIFFGCVTSVYRGYYEGLRNMIPTAV
ncbi:MAG: oligosaccharide flippase family protein, partial [Oscillospiraceae bacterium]|nr:oligosaccharide flippase family protein [Oscillospiraceae bacterium]